MRNGKRLLVCASVRRAHDGGKLGSAGMQCAPDRASPEHPLHKNTHTHTDRKHPLSLGHQDGSVIPATILSSAMHQPCIIKIRSLIIQPIIAAPPNHPRPSHASEAISYIEVHRRAPTQPPKALLYNIRTASAHTTPYLFPSVQCHRHRPNRNKNYCSDPLPPTIFSQPQTQTRVDSHDCSLSRFLRELFCSPYTLPTR